MGERGSISLVAVGILAGIAMAAVLLGQLGADAVRRARATAIADVVALAAAAEQAGSGSAGPGSAGSGGSAAAQRVAAANGAAVVSSVRYGFQTEVVVSRAGVEATARAEFRPLDWRRCPSSPPANPVHSGSCPTAPIR